MKHSNVFDKSAEPCDLIGDSKDYVEHDADDPMGRGLRIG